MPKLEVKGVGTFDVPEGERLVLAIEEDSGVTFCIAAAPTPDIPPAASSTSKASLRR